MSSKLFIVLFACLVVVAIEATYLEESRDEGTEHEMCVPQMITDEEQGFRCCHHNFHLSKKEAKKQDDHDAMHKAIDDMCDCYNYVMDKVHGEQPEE